MDEATDLKTRKGEQSIRNHTCIYCGCRHSVERPFTREHVIGRKFVPRGSIAGCWNVIANACGPCNASKADLEDDISAILLRWSGDPALADEAHRKAQGSVSRRTGKPVMASDEHLSVGGNWGPAQLTVGMVSPPQIDLARVDQLATFHLQGLFYLQSYNARSREGLFIPDAITIESASPKDWGNDRFKWFQAHTEDWRLTFRGISAGEHFKAAFRACPNDPQVRSFALEWNKQMRVVGFFGATENIDRHASLAPEHRWMQIGPDRRMREEVRLPEHEDELFDRGAIGVDPA